ncbi:MAG: tripartite tricarboxylate transporter permease [Methanomicrobiales archaeon]
MFDILIACVLGVLCGTFTGLVPGIHVNTAGAFLFASSPILLNFLSPEFLCVFLFSMSIAHALLEFIPSTFLGVPEEGTLLSILPGHDLLLQGRGKELIRLVSLGGFGAIIVTILLSPIFIIVIPPIYIFLKPYIWILLVIVVISMMIRMNGNLKSFLWSTFLFIISGILGWIMLNLPISSNVSLLCIFTGLFGTSTLLYSLNQRSVLPSQNKYYNLRIDITILRGIFAGGIAGTIMGFLPGLGPAQGSLIAQELSGGGKEINNKESFLVAMSGVNTADALFSMIAIYMIGNPRSGIAVYISKILVDFSLSHLVLFIFVSITAVSISLFLCLKLGDVVSEYLQKLNYKKLCWTTIVFMSLLVVVFSVIENVNILFIILVYITSISIGLIPNYTGVNKSNLMGVLIIPAVVVYFNLGL